MTSCSISWNYLFMQSCKYLIIPGTCVLAQTMYKSMLMTHRINYVFMFTFSSDYQSLTSIYILLDPSGMVHTQSGLYFTCKTYDNR